MVIRSGVIHNDDFEQYIKEKTRALTGIKESDYLYKYIDWKSLAEDRKKDYKLIELDGEVYWARS